MRPLRGWLPVHSQSGLQLGLLLARRDAEFLAVVTLAGDVQQLDEACHRTPLPLGGDHRRPAGVVIFAVPYAAAIADVEGVDPGGQSVRAEWPGQHQVSGPETGIDPAVIPLDEAHQSMADHRLALELRSAAEVRYRCELVE